MRDSAIFSERFSLMLRYFGIKQIDVIRKTGIPQSTISSYVTLAKKPKIESIEKIASAYNVNPMWLAGYDEEMFKSPIEEKAKKDADLLKMISALPDADREMIYDMISRLLKK